MRIKWNRHLDGSATRQSEENPETQEADEKELRPSSDDKKHKASSSQGILRLFRRKKSRKRSEDDGKIDTATDVQKELVDDECASISSIATCGSQPTSEGFSRDRASSLFSSFRLSLPGSKRKKRRIAPAPSDTVLNGQQQGELQVDRYSTPDLRKPSDKLAGSDVPQVSHSTSSPSIQNSKGIPNSVQSLDGQNFESYDNVKINGNRNVNYNSSPSVSHSKSVTTDQSFCKQNLATVNTDKQVCVRSSESVITRYPNALNGVNPSAKNVDASLVVNVPSPNTKTVNEGSIKLFDNQHRNSGKNIFSKSNVKLCKSVSFSNCEDSFDSKKHAVHNDVPPRAAKSTVMFGEPKSDLPVCLSDNLCESSKLTSFGDLPGAEANVPNPQKQLGDERSNSLRMTKTKVFEDDSTTQSRISRIDTILTDIVADIRGFTKDNDGIPNRSDSVQRCQIPLLSNFDSNSQPFEHESVNNGVHEDTNYDRHRMRDILKTPPGVLNVQTGTFLSPVPEWNTSCESHNSSDNDFTLPIEKNENTVDQNESSIYNTEVLLNKNNLCSPSLARLTVVTSIKNDKKSVVCDQKINSFSVAAHQVNTKQDNCFDIESSICEEKPQCDYKFASDIHTYSKLDTAVDKDISSSIKVNSAHFLSEDNQNNTKQPDSVSIVQPVVCKNDSYNLKKYTSGLNSGYKINECDQQVPNEFSFNEYPLTNEQEVPEFELSILEFEETCNDYLSRQNQFYSDSTAEIPVFENSSMIGSDINIDSSVLSSTVDESSGAAHNLNDINENSDIIVIASDLKLQNGNLHPKCQSVSDKFTLPTPPKQWINNCGKAIETECNRDVCTDRVQCAETRGKNLCHKPSLEVLPSTVMHGESDLEDIDMHLLSSTLETFNGGESISNGTVVHSNRTPDSMVSELSNSVSISQTLSDLDYSSVLQSPSNDSIYLDVEIREPYRHKRGICDPHIYSSERTKITDPLDSETYLSGHNFTDIIKDISCDYIRNSQGLIEISNPYDEDSFIIHKDIVSKDSFNDADVSILIAEANGDIDENNFINGSDVSSLSVDKDITNVDSSDAAITNVYTNDLSDGKCATNNADKCLSDQTSVGNDFEKSQNRTFEVIKTLNVNDGSKTLTGNISSINVVEPRASEKIKNGENSKGKLRNIEKKNVINKNKSSMIPCRKVEPRNVENKQIDVKRKSKKISSTPKSRKSEPTTTPKSKSSLRALSNSIKDSEVEQIKRKEIPEFNGNNSQSFFFVSLHTENEDRKLKNPKKVTRKDSGYDAEIKTLNGCKNAKPKPPESSNGGREYHLDTKIESNCVPIDNGECSVSEQSTPFPLKRSSTFICDNASSILSGDGYQFSKDQQDINFDEDYKSEDTSSLLNHEDTPSVCSESVSSYTDSKHLDNGVAPPKCSSQVGLVKRNFTSSKESITSQLTNSSNRGLSRIPKKQPSTRGPQSHSKGPVRPPMWLSKAELTQEIQRLGTLCESRTKELNRLKMETKHVSAGFDAFAALFKYMVEDLNALSVPNLTEDLQKTLKQLELTKQDLAFYERKVEEMESHHSQELNDLSNKLFEVYQGEVAELNAKQQEEINILKSDNLKQIEVISAKYEASSAEAIAQADKMVANMEQEINKQREELELFHERELRDIEEKTNKSTKLLQDHINQLQKKCAELERHSLSMEDAMQKDTDSKLQWVSAAKSDLEKEVESLKAVLEMKNKELHTLRVQNLEMEKQLEELPIAREKIKMLQARAEDLEALMVEKTNAERKLCTENQEMRDTFEKEAKINRRLSMENETLQWRLREAEKSIISGSFSEGVSEFPEVEESVPVLSPTKSPSPQVLSRSVFFTFMDKEECASGSPRTPYKKITPGFSSGYKTSPAKSSKSPPVPTPQRPKSHSEPPQPPIMASTPRKSVKLQSSKNKSVQKRQRSDSAGRQIREIPETEFSSVTDSMASSFNSECSMMEPRLLDEHKEQIIHSLEILREQRRGEHSSIISEDPTIIEKRWSRDDMSIAKVVPNLETEDMSRSAEFSDPKTYYHMTFPVLKESNDNEDGARSSSSAGSPVKEVRSIKHSKSEDNLKSPISVEAQVMSMSMQESHTTVTRNHDTLICNSTTESDQKDSKCENGYKTL